ncbi:MAG: hypothetical protein IKL56_05920 [Bacteroidaceae bacterium]|nr:hypothetical protein [Bacteroidaceae bacterium]MBR3616141.1 hypothetical protein [Bacteroidaceae bacterium]
MKAIKYLSILALSLFTMTSCMNDFDEPDFKEPPFGNNEIGEANMTIAELKAKYASTISASGVKEVTEDIIIEGVVVADDATGNVYKQFIINDETGAIIIGVNDVGLYAMVPVGQRVRIDCKGLHVGGYGKMAQVGGLYEGKIGRMAKSVYREHVRLVGEPSMVQPELVPEVIDDTYFTNENKENLAKFVRLENVEITEANGTELWAPEELAYNNVVERHIKMGKTNLVLRMSTYADFANEAIPDGKLNINGVLTRYNDYWQFVISSTGDIQQIAE